MEGLPVEEHAGPVGVALPSGIAVIIPATDIAGH